MLEHTLDIALKDTLDIGKRCVERYAWYCVHTLDMGHKVLATLEHTYCVEKLRRVGIYA